MAFLKNKRALIVGVASERSIAWGIAQAMHRQGADIALTYQTEKLKPRVEKYAAELGSTLTMPLDLTRDEDIDNCFNELGKHWDGLDIIVHSAAFAPREELAGSYVDN